MSHPIRLPLPAQELIRLTPLSPPVVRRRIANYLTVFSAETGVTAARPLQVLAAMLAHATSDEADGFCWPGSKRLAGLVGCSYSVFRAARLALYGTGRVRRETREVADARRTGYAVEGWDDVHDDDLGDAEADDLEAGRRAQNSELKTPNSELPIKKALRPEVVEEVAQPAPPADPILDADIEAAHGEVEETFLITSQEWGCYRGWALKYQLRLNPSVTKHTLLCWRARAEVEGRRGRRAFWMSCIEGGYSNYSEKEHLRIRERRLVEDWEAANGDVTTADALPRDRYKALSPGQQERVRAWVCERHGPDTRTGRAVRAKQGLSEDDWAVVGEAMTALCL